MNIPSILINYWLKLVNGKRSKCCTIMYDILLVMYHSDRFQSLFLDNAGLSNVWAHPLNFSATVEPAKKATSDERPPDL